MTGFLRNGSVAGICAALGWMPAASMARGAEAPDKTNVIIVLVDDTGYGDVSCLGSPIVKTPNIDHLHDQSIRLTDFHVSPMCTPTRGELMSGVDALDNGAMNVSSGRSMLRQKCPTMADLFAGAGYQTAMFGKWHLGDVYPYRPEDRGFQTAMWFPSSHISSSPDHWNNDYFDPYLRQTDGSEKQIKGYCTDIFFEQGMEWIKKQAGKPFFLYLPLNAAHAPWYVPDKYRDPFRKLPHNLASFYGMIANIDENVGKLDRFLADNGLAGNTLLVYMTDNGGTLGVPVFNGGMKGAKISLYDGGHRVPCFLRLPNGKLGRTRDVGALTEVQDMLPTLADLCGLKKPEHLSGVSLMPLLHDEQPLADRMLVVQFSRMNKSVPSKNDATVLWNKWRLVNGSELYDIIKDPHEDHNVAATNTEVGKKMQDYYDHWWAAIAPTVNQFSPILIGTENEPVTKLSTADWMDVFLDQQKQIRTATLRNGEFSLVVTRDGNYTFELRRYPREADTAITAGLPVWQGVDGRLPAAVALPIAKAKLRVGSAEATAAVGPNDKFVRFILPLKAGSVTEQSRFYDAAGKEICGAYYVYVSLNK